MHARWIQKLLVAVGILLLTGVGLWLFFSDSARGPATTIEPTSTVAPDGTPDGSTSVIIDDLSFGDICVWCVATATVDIPAQVDGGGITAVRVVGGDAARFRLAQECLDPETSDRAVLNCEVTFVPIAPGLHVMTVEIEYEQWDEPLALRVSGSGVCERPTNREVELLSSLVGFGEAAYGGRDGCRVAVTTLEDSGPGSLREALEREGPAWVVFDVSGEISLDKNIQVDADKTVDGRGASITLEGAGLYLVNTSNVIVTNIRVDNAWEDGVQLRGLGTVDIWIDHVTISNAGDGAIDITQGATDITISWSRFERSDEGSQEKTILIGANDPGDPDEVTSVTLHHNYFMGTTQRHPLLRAGYVHSFNNYFDGWDIYGSGVERGGRLLSERNVYDGSNVRTHADRAFTLWSVPPAYIRSVQDRFLGGARGSEEAPDGVEDPDYPYDADDADDELVDAIKEKAGANRDR